MAARQESDQQDLEKAEEDNEIYIEDHISPIGIFLYTWMLRLFFILSVGFIFGTFTDGGPPKWSYVYLLPTAYDLLTKIRLARGLLWHSTELFSFGMPDAIFYLHQNNGLVLLIFCLIIALITQIGIYYQ